MSGETKSTIEDRAQRFQEVAFGKLDHSDLIVLRPSETSRYLNMEHQEINALTAADASEGAYILGRYVIYLQDQYNKLQSELHYYTNRLSLLIGKTGHDYGDGYTKYEERKFRVIANDSAAKEYNDKIIIIEAACMQANNQLRHLQRIMDTLIEISRVRRNNG